MTIMLAGGMSFAAPSMMPAAFAANANLFVSAENSQFDNYMSGPQVIEVVVIDSDINDTDQSKGEPDVTVNGKILRMVQAVDGNWYGYFADRRMAQIADSTTTIAGSGLDFGGFCSASSAGQIVGVNLDDTNGVAVPIVGSGSVNGSATGATITATCTDGATTATDGIINVLREAKLPNVNVAANPADSEEAIAEEGSVAGQIGIDSDKWPFIQLYTLNPTGNVIVQYNKGGGVQSTTLTFDSVDQFASSSLDRSKYTQLSQVHATITDLWLNIDPTDEDSWTFGTNAANATSRGAHYQVFDENGGSGGAAINIDGTVNSLMCEDNCRLLVNANAQNAANPVLTLQDNDDSILTQLNIAATANNATSFGVASATAQLGTGSVPVTITEQGPNSGVFGTYDESDVSALKITSNAARGTSATIDYNETPVTILVGFGFASVDMQPTDDEWNSGEEIPVVIVDSDANKNSRADEDLDLNNPDVTIIPTLKTGTPNTLSGTNQLGGFTAVLNNTMPTNTVDKFSQRGIITLGANTTIVNGEDLTLTFGTMADVFGSTPIDDASFTGYALFNYDVRSLNNEDTFHVNTVDISLAGLPIATGEGLQGLILLNGTAFGGLASTTPLTANFTLNTSATGFLNEEVMLPVVADVFGFGFLNDGLEADERIANQIIRIEAEETGDNTSTFEGSLEYIMINQLNINDPDTYADISPIANDPSFIVIEDLTDEDSPRVNYNDLGADGVVTQVADQEEAPSHSGIVSFDQRSYKNADTVTITLEDLDLNVDSDLIDIYTVVTVVGDANKDAVGSPDVTNGGTSITLTNGEELGRLLDVTFDDARWITPAAGTCLTELTAITSDTGLGATGFTLIETGPETGIFIGDFQIPGAYCSSDTATARTVTGLDIEVNYVDFRDASGETIEVGDGAGVRATTGSVSLDRTVYPVPFGIPDRFATTTSTNPDGRSIFPIHQTGMNTAGTARSAAGLQSGEFLEKGGLTVHVRVNDPDFDTSASGEDTINVNTAAAATGPVKISVIRGASTTVLGYAGGPTAIAGVMDVNSNAIQKEAGVGGAAGLYNDDPTVANVDVDADGIPEVNGADVIIRQFGPMDEIAPDAGIFESDILIRYTDGPASSSCPDTNDYVPINGASATGINPFSDRFDVTPSIGDYCILQGDILQVEYTDPADASGDVNTVTDSATFDLRNGVLQSDKSVYIIGSDMILTLIEPDLDLDNDQAETYDLDLIEWDSDAATVTMGDADGAGAAFDPEPLNFRETGDSTGIFQIVIEIPQELDGDNLERGEEIVLEYTDWGPSGSDYVGDEDEDVNLTIFTSNFGATVELDQKVYTWTDKVYITIVAPDHNFDSNLVDEIGDTSKDPIKVSTRGFDIDNYKLVETGTDTGIFTGEVILTGFEHDADGVSGFDTNPRTQGSGPTDGYLQTDDDDGLTVSFEFSEDETIVGSALIRWNIGEVQWLEASYPASGTGVVRVIDPDMNLDPEAVDNFDVDTWSDSDAGGIDLTVTETNEATGIFEGTVFFTTTDESSGHRLRVSEGDTVTASYEDNTLPNPYTTADELDITATSLIGTVVPPLERAPAANLRTVDAFGNSLDTVSVDQQVQISADLANGQDREQQFAYLVQIQDGNGVTVSLAWITGSLSAGQSFSPALSWIPTEAGTYSATAFVWESVDNPTALSPPVSTTITVR
jgi:hypothetical protein